MNNSVKAKEYIDSIKPYKQGKSQIAYKGKIIKLSSNENALGTSKKAIAAYKEHSKKLYRYADGNCTRLREALGELHKIAPERIVCGAGSDEIIALLIQSFAGEGDEIIYSEHGFLMYAISAQKFGAKALAAKETDLKGNIDNILALISNKTKLIFIANPNNPTGSYLNKNEIEKLIKNTPKNVIIVLDLAYDEFVDLSEDERCDSIKLVNENTNVVLTKTFSKIYGLASARLGWSYSSEYIADILNKSRGPFNVSGSAVEAGIAAVKDQKFVAKSLAHNKKWLNILESTLRALKIKTYTSAGNFILIDFLSENKCQEANKFLLENGVIVREMKEYHLPNCLRMTIGTRSENVKVIKLLKKFQEI